MTDPAPPPVSIAGRSGSQLAGQVNDAKRVRPTVADLRAGKGKHQLTNLYVESVQEAAAAERAGIDIVTVQDSRMTPQHRAVAPAAFIVVGLEYGRVITTDDYLRSAFVALNHGADAVWSAAGLATIGRLGSEGIPVVGHVGLIPPRRTWTGGYRAVGKTASSALEVWEATQALEQAGAFAAEIEVVPAEVATAISERTSLVMISMGSGSGCDAQYLFATDVLGTNTGHVPRHAKQYADLGSELARVQRMRVKAFADFASDVESGGFPDDERLVPMKEAELREFLTTLDR